MNSAMVERFWNALKTMNSTACVAEVHFFKKQIWMRFGSFSEFLPQSRFEKAFFCSWLNSHFNVLIAELCCRNVI